MNRNEINTSELERFLTIGPAEVPRLREFVVDGCATGLTRLQTDEGEDWIIACVDVGKVPATHAEVANSLLLKANNLWAGTRGNTLGLYGADDTVVLSQSMHMADTSPQKLGQTLSDLVADARQWRVLLGRLAEQASPVLD